jgi:riboflavin-specific deaminase-like protein
MLSLCLAASLDGKLNSESDGAPRFSSRADRDRLFRLRAEADLILVGAGTVRHESLPPLVRNSEFAELRRGRPAHPAVAVVTQSQRLPWQSAYFRERQQDIFVLTPTVFDETRRRCEALGIEALAFGETGLAGGLKCLRDRGFHRVLAEGGGKLVHALLEEDLVERFYLTLAPVVFGGRSNPSLADGPAFLEARVWQLDRSDVVGDELHLSYTRRR